MTIASATRKAGPFSGSGSTGPFAFTFKVFAAADLYVVKAVTATGVETVLTLTTDYTVSLNADQDTNPGGTITLVSALAVGYTMIITTALAYLQSVDLTNQGGFYPEVVTQALDKLTIFVQQLDEQLARCAKVTITSAVTVDDLVEDIIAVADDQVNIDAVAGDLTNIDAVAGDLTNINDVAGNHTNIDTVAADHTNIDTVAGISADITAVAGAVTDIATAAANVTDITNFADVYYGPSATDPTTRKDLSALQAGDLYYNTATDRVKVYTGAAWISGVDTVMTPADASVTIAKLATDTIGFIQARKDLRSLFVPSLSEGMYGAWKAGWEPFWHNQQWGGAPWMDNLVDGATGEAYTFQALTGYAENDSFARGVGYDATYQYVFQSFKVSKAATIAAIWLKLYKNGNPTDNLQVYIQDDNAGVPNTTIANGTATAQAGTLHTSNTTGGWYRFTFATPPSLSADTKYHIVLSRSGANSTTNYWVLATKAAGTYPHGNDGYGSSVPAWTGVTAQDMCFMVEPVTNILAASGQFDSKVTFSEGSPLNQSEAMTQPLKNFFNHQEGTISIVGASWTKDKTIWDAQYGLDHDRIVLRCNVTTGYAQVDLYEKDGTKHTVTGTTDISDATVRRITIAYRAKNDGSDFLKLYINATSEGSPVTGASIQFDPLMKELGHISLGGGYALAPTWTKETLMASLPAADGWTYDGTATEAAHAVVSGGKLFIQIVGSTDDCYWHIHPTLVNANGWAVAWKKKVVKASDVTAELEAYIAIRDDVNIVMLAFHTYYIEVSYDHGATYVKYQIDMTKEHSFYAEGKGSDFRLYCDEKLVFDGTGLFTHADATGASIHFGDADATAASNAESIWDYIKYYETASLPPQFTSGSLSEFAYFSGDQTGLLAALYNSGTLKSVKELCGVGRNYIEVGERSVRLNGITNAPTSVAAYTAPALVPDMELFAYGKEFDVSVDQSIMLSNANTWANSLVYIDGKAMSKDAYYPGMVTAYTTNAVVAESVSGKEKSSFGLHKIKNISGNSGGTSTFYGKTRSMKVRVK